MKRGSPALARRTKGFHSAILTAFLFGNLVLVGGCHDPERNVTATKSVKPLPPVEAACADGQDNDADGRLDCDDSDCQSPGGECVPAPPLDRTVATTVAESAAHLYQGANPLQKHVVEGALDRQRIALLRGRSIDVIGAPLPAVKISVKGHPEYGYSYSRGDGMFDLAVQGGARLVLQYELDGYLPVQRAVQPGWQRYLAVPDVGLVMASSVESRVTANSAQSQTIVGERASDDFGQRQPLVVIDANTRVRARSVDGPAQDLDALTVTTTEYPISSSNSFAPGTVNSAGGLSYGLEFVVKEAAALGVEHVEFSKPVSFYVENLAELPIGKRLVVQQYDRRSGQWEPGLRGQVIELLAVGNGGGTDSGGGSGDVEIDVDGDGVADNDAKLATAGITESDRSELGRRFTAGQRLWHAELDHFSGLNVQAEGSLPSGALPPLRRGIVTKTLDKPTYRNGMVVEYQASTYAEPLSGTPFTLHYQSNRTLSYGAGRAIEVPLLGETVPSGLKKIRSRVAIANHVFEEEFKDPKEFTSALRHKVIWDGTNATGQMVQAQQNAEVTIAYVYQDASNSKLEATSSVSFSVPLGNWDARAFGLGGFSIDVHCAYDPAQQILYLGNGTQRSGNNVAMAAQLASADERFVLGTPDSLFVAADGSLVFTDDQQGTDSFGRVLQIGHDGMPKVLFGDGATTATAAAMQLSQPQGILVTSDGRLIIADIFEQRIVEVSPDGVQRTLVSGIAEDEPSVLQALNRPDGMALGPREELYFVDADRVYRLEAGKLETLAGGGAETTDSGNAIDAKLVVPSGLAVDRDGNIFVSERGQAGQPGGHRVRQISPNGMITTIAGNGSPGYAGDDDLAATAQLNDPHGLALDPDGRLYIVDQGNNRIRRISTDGMIQTVIGGGTQPLSPNSMALNVKLDTPDGIAAGPDGSLYIAQKNTVIRAFVGMPKVTRDDYLVPSTDGRTLYHFDTRGKHLETIDVLTGITELTFAYDSAGQLIGITDKDQNVTKIERDTSGNATAVIGPYGQRTGFALDGSGNLASIVDALKRQTTITWDPRQLIGAVNSPKSKATTYRYDVNGRLTNTSDPTGIGETLKRSELANGWQVDVTNSANQTTGFVVQHRGETWTRTYIAADQTKSSLTDAGANLTRRAPDGTQQEVTFLAHEVFGAQVPRPYVDRVTLPSGKSIETTYTPTYHLKPSGSPIDLLDQTDAAETNGRWYESKFTRAGATMVRTSPTGRTAQITLNSLGRPSTFTAEGSPSTQWKYDAHGRPQTMTRSANNQVRTDVIGYDAGGFVARLTDPLKQEIISRRDVMGRLKELERPDGKKTSWDLDSADNVTSLTPPNSQAHLFSYYEVSKLLRDITPPAVANGGSPVRFDYDDLSDEVSELKRITRGDGRSIGFEYDALGRLSAQKLEKATLNFNYTQGHLTRINRSDGVAIDQTFDGPLWTSSKWTGSVSGTVKATYDKNFWLSSLTVNDASTVNFTYDDDGLLTAATALVGGATFARDAATGNISEIRAGNTATQQRFSGFGELSQLSTSVSGASLFEQTIVERDALGRIAHLRETVQGASHDLYYAYDLVGRLTKQTRDGIATSYGYDANGNRTTLQVDNIAPVTATYDAQDRILASGTQTYELDGHGDMRSRADGVKRMELTYDELGNLMKVVLADGSTQRIIEYVVDGLGRRVARRINGNFDKKWLYRDSLRPIAEVDAAGVFTHFVCASNSPLGGAPVAMIRGGVLYRIVQDQLGSVRLVVNTQTGEVAQRIDYDAYGRVLSETGAGFQPFGFAGGLYDAETGLVRFGARDYDAETGRWTNRDPIGFAGQQGNQYLYVEGDPINGLDPDGRWGVALGLGGDLGYCFGWCVGSWGLSGGIYIDHRSGVGVYGSGQAGMGLGAHAGLSLQLSGFNSLSAFHGNSYGLELTMPGPSGSAAGNESGGVFSGTLGVGGGLYVGPVVTHTKTYGISWAEASEAWEFAAYDASAWWSDITIAMMRAFNKYLPTSFFW